MDKVDLLVQRMRQRAELERQLIAESCDLFGVDVELFAVDIELNPIPGRVFETESGFRIQRTIENGDIYIFIDEYGQLVNKIYKNSAFDKKQMHRPSTITGEMVARFITKSVPYNPE